MACSDWGLGGEYPGRGTLGLHLRLGPDALPRCYKHERFQLSYRLSTCPYFWGAASSRSSPSSALERVPRRAPMMSAPAAWKGNGECGGAHKFGSPLLYNHPPRCSPARAEAELECKGEAPRVAFLIAGQARAFLEDEAYKTFDEVLVRPFALPRQHALTFLLLKLEYNSSLIQRRLDAAIGLLRPAAIRVFIERSNDGRLYADLHRTRAARAMVRTPSCFWRDTPPHYVLQQAAVWWGTMASAWELLEQWELSRGARHASQHRAHQHRAAPDGSSDGSTSHRRHELFDVVVFARPDIFYQVPFGAWCTYDLTRTW